MTATPAQREATLAQFKYCRGCAAFEDCPPPHCQPRSGEWFRIVFADNDAKSFLPPYQMNPQRALEPGESCDYWALTFFDTPQSACRKYSYLAKVLKDRMKLFFGDYIAKVQVSEQDGVASLPSKRSGHINLHEFLGAQLEQNSIIIGPAIDARGLS